MLIGPGVCRPCILNGSRKIGKKGELLLCSNPLFICGQRRATSPGSPDPGSVYHCSEINIVLLPIMNRIYMQLSYLELEKEGDKKQLMKDALHQIYLHK